ncbi:MAG: amidohydrolase family protein [Balneolales bacterium]
MQPYQTIPKIDAHIHYNFNRTSLLDQAQEDDFSFITINTDVPFFPSINEQQLIAQHQEKAFPDLMCHIATFSVVNWEDDHWQEHTIKALQQEIDGGAVGVKVWKNIGMDLTDQNGQMVMINDPRFDPILNFLEENNIPVLGHLGEPKNCWLPVEQMTVTQDKDYFSEHPEYHMHLHPEYPSYEDQINARDHMLEKHPDLRFVGAHLASLEWDVDEVAKRLDKFPNLAVDLAERICHLQYQAVTDHQKVLDFMVNYQDRIIYGTDVIDDGTMSDQELRNHIHALWLAHWEFFTTSKTLTAAEVPVSFKGLKLPQEIIEKIYYKNALKWYSL